MKVSAQYASTHFDELSSAVDGGEIVEIERQQKPALRLVLVERAVEVATVQQPLENQSAQAQAVVQQAKPLRMLGAGRAELRVPSDEEWAALDRELWGDLLDSHLTVNDNQ